MPDKKVNERDIRINFSRLHTPTDNATVESFNGRLRQECLNGNGLCPWKMPGAKSGPGAYTIIRVFHIPRWAG
ncbi:hypothetical protein CBW22_11960 [Pantoea sp. VS1]|nr:hypothetical protein CBW22_11960 [Pantoea sp. VS1]